MTTSDPKEGQPPARPEPVAAAALDRAALRKALDTLGWKFVNRRTVAIRHERELQVGLRTVRLRGRVEVPLPEILSAEAGAAAATLRAEAAVTEFRATVERIIARTLQQPDDVEVTHVFDRASFAEAVFDGERILAQTYQALADRRLDDAVEAELGLSFYLEALHPEQRTFEYFVGPTNSGKTHAAIEALRAAPTGVYLAPLRLLALEIYERLNDAGVATSLITGEERIHHPYGRHTSSTVEMIDLHTALDVAVIDEVQMLEDPQRGWAWTQAIAGVRAKHVILCGSPEGLGAAQRLADHLGVTLAVRHFRRKNPLRVVAPIRLTELEPGDALVAFSRKAVIEMQAEVAARGFSSAAIYGSLSPIVRRREAERFRSGAADVLVATDAIGLGLNLPIRRVVFSAIDKWDGTEMRQLTTFEIRQLAGRAGRYGLHEEGLVTGLNDRDHAVLERSLAARDAPADQRPIWIAPTDEHLRRLAGVIGTQRIGRLLHFFQTRVLQRRDDDLRIADLGDQIDVASALETSDTFMELPLETRLTYSRCPVNTRGPALRILMRWANAHASGNVVDGREIATASSNRDQLLGFEDNSRLATLYLWLAHRFPHVYIRFDEIVRVRDGIDRSIASALLQRGTHSKRGGKGRRRPRPAAVRNIRRQP